MIARPRAVFSSGPTYPYLIVNDEKEFAKMWKRIRIEGADAMTESEFLSV